MLTVDRYANMSSATVPVALAAALDEGRVKPGSLILMPAFGAGLTYCAHVVRWGERVTPISVCPDQLPPCKKSALEMVNAIRAQKAANAARSEPALGAARFADVG
jgi:3-oxoacyl-[acyl-carrier-protein] synthase-3